MKYDLPERLVNEISRFAKKSGIRKIILFGSRAKGTNTKRSDIDIAVSGADDFEILTEKIEELPTLYSVDLVNLDTCKNQLLLEDIRQYGRKI